MKAASRLSIEEQLRKVKVVPAKELPEENFSKEEFETWHSVEDSKGVFAYFGNENMAHAFKLFVVNMKINGGNPWKIK